MVTTDREQERKPYDPQPDLIQLDQRTRQSDGTWQTTQADYLPVRHRLQWLRDREPEARLETRFEQVTPDYAAVTCTITLASGAVGSGVGVCFRQKFERYAEKAETSAIGRACASLGFGTQWVGDEYDEDDGAFIADAPVERRPQQPPSARPYAAPRPQPQNGQARPAYTEANPQASGWSQPASEPQMKAIRAIAASQHISGPDLERLIAGSHSGRGLGQLTKREASNLIEMLKEQGQEGD